MEIFKRRYGRLGKLRRAEWEEFLNSNNGLFKRRVERAPDYVIGPRLSESGQLIGDTETAEATFFGRVASRDQDEFLTELTKTNPVSAHEYMLTIIGAIEIWKEDIKWMEMALDYLKKEKKALKRGEELITEEEKINTSVKLPPVLKRHFPQLFKDVEIDNLDFKRLLEKIREAESKVKSREHYIKGYLKKKKKEMPFLFE